jgi:hypothetical protein
MEEVFQDVSVSPLEAHVNTWTSIREDKIICQIPRHAIVHTQPSVECLSVRTSRRSYGHNHPEDQLIIEAFKTALNALSKFPNLNSIEIVFTPEFQGDHGDNSWTDVLEDVPLGKQLLTMIFRAITDRALNKDKIPICKLTIINLQN